MQQVAGPGYWLDKDRPVEVDPVDAFDLGAELEDLGEFLLPVRVGHLSQDLSVRVHLVALSRPESVGGKACITLMIIDQL